jgi:hypothetical protein
MTVAPDPWHRPGTHPVHESSKSPADERALARTRPVLAPRRILAGLARFEVSGDDNKEHSLFLRGGSPCKLQLKSALGPLLGSLGSLLRRRGHQAKAKRRDSLIRVPSRGDLCTRDLAFTRMQHITRRL